ncbi:oligosaccharide flippase family protein [Microbacterium luticocti]|uniref:oligosaccharide flippase family protein n=1 Tax=Microbacterium luticocti TaxID=451764 RepID=UPI0003FA810F|nr:oligosaccharide flippase family protein [Microbacterium luticocti]
MTVDEPTLTRRAVQGAAWSGLSSIVLRLGSLVVGIVVARILTPDQFGVFAVALTVQSILMTLADLGLSADLVRTDEPARLGPTIATLGLVTGAMTTALAVGTAPLLASALGSPEASGAIALLSVTLLLAGAGVVPYALLLRRFQQRELFAIGAADFVVYTAVTLLLVSVGWGALGLAAGRVCAQVVALVLQFVIARERPRFGIDRALVRPILAFGVPIAVANLIGWGLLNVDNIVLARMVGVTALGYYVLAFNVSSWPMSALSQVVRSIALPYFSRTDDGGAGLARVTAAGWALALPAGAVLAALSGPVIAVLYGEKWMPAAAVLAALGLHGSLRVVFDIATGYLYARGRSRAVLWIQLLWLGVLLAALIVAVPRWGIAGAGWAQVAVAAVVVLPAHLIALRAAGVRLGPLLAEAGRPTLAAAVGASAAAVLCTVLPHTTGALIGAVAVGAAVYAAAMAPWARRQAHTLRGAR